MPLRQQNDNSGYRPTTTTTVVTKTTDPTNTSLMIILGPTVHLPDLQVPVSLREAQQLLVVGLRLLHLKLYHDQQQNVETWEVGRKRRMFRTRRHRPRRRDPILADGGETILAPLAGSLSRRLAASTGLKETPCGGCG
ncbi:hypothetical protein T4D_10808 [Trichinella pseudospiralis]|uniref:Uncharacterized protein n=1 Tax=Trichinella pseudospiralis TaxID=6337 RepID=A0A0V1FPD4_TRIPS|nr:hypothetical protein T4D_10808 [Trichinella pseudospiralis]